MYICEYMRRTLGTRLCLLMLFNDGVAKGVLNF